jgi:hypothetical protein
MAGTPNWSTAGRDPQPGGTAGWQYIPVLHQEHAIAVINAASHVCDTIPTLAPRDFETLALPHATPIARIRAEEELRAERLLFMAGR